MNKILLLVGGLLALGLNTYSKEVVAAPVAVEEPAVVVSEPTPVPVVATPEWILSTRVGGDVWSEYTNTDSDGTGYEVGLELLRQYAPDSNLYLGLGAMYQSHADGEDGGEYDSVPVYGTAKYNFYERDDVAYYAKCNLGYSFNFNEEDIDYKGNKYSQSLHDGMYWAAGLGAEYRNFFADLMYQQTMASSRPETSGADRDDNNYDRVTLGVGYNFDLNF